MTAGNAVQRSQHFDRLRREGYRMFLTFFHAVGRDAPDRCIKVEFNPLGLNGFTRSAEGKPHQAEGCFGFMPSTVAFHVPQKLADFVEIQRTLVLGFVGGKSLSNRIDRISISPESGYGKLKDTPTWFASLQPRPSARSSSLMHSARPGYGTDQYS